MQGSFNFLSPKQAAGYDLRAEVFKAFRKEDPHSLKMILRKIIGAQADGQWAN